MPYNIRFALLTAVMSLPAAMTIGCMNLPPHEQQKLQLAARQYQQGQCATAAPELDRLIRDYATSPEIAEAYYLRGLCRFKSNQLPAAKQDFEHCLDKSGHEELTARCQASLAAIAYQQADWDSAADLYRKATPYLPYTPPTDEILLSAGLAMQRVGRWDDAAMQFSRILRQFRNRPTAREARRRSAWRHPFYSIQLGAFRDADNAATAVRDFRLQGLDPRQENLPRDNQALWIVMTGRYATYADARAALPRVRQVQPDAVIIP